MSAEDVTKRCYICNQFFDDRVKLGMHISACYDEAVNVRKELWHPHPLDLVDQQHYTQYMANKHRYTIDQLKDARHRGISFVTADAFDAIKGHLPSGNRKRDGMHSANVAQPSHTGVTVLKTELSSEIEKLRQLREEEERRIAERENRFERMCNEIEGKMSVQSPPQSQGPSQHRRLQSSPPAAVSGNDRVVVVRDAPQQQVQQRPSSRSSHQFPLPQATGSTFSPITGAVPSKHAAPQPHIDSAPLVSVRPGTVEKAAVNKPRVMDDGRIECPVCRKLFGRRGYEAHSKRCGLHPDDDFTFSQDARLHEEKAGRMKVTEPPTLPGEQDEKWTQFMTTYPRPILPESPQSPQARSKAAELAAQRREYDALVAREMQRPYAGVRSTNK